MNTLCSLRNLRKLRALPARFEAALESVDDPQLLTRLADSVVRAACAAGVAILAAVIVGLCIL